MPYIKMELYERDNETRRKGDHQGNRWIEGVGKIMLMLGNCLFVLERYASRKNILSRDRQ